MYQNTFLSFAKDIFHSYRKKEHCSVDAVVYFLDRLDIIHQWSILISSYSLAACCIIGSVIACYPYETEDYSVFVYLGMAMMALGFSMIPLAIVVEQKLCDYLDNEKSYYKI